MKKNTFSKTQNPENEMINTVSMLKTKDNAYKSIKESILSKLPNGIHLAQTQEEIQAIIDLRKNYYQDNTEEVKAFHNDGLDSDGYVFYSTDSKGNITSTVRLLLDSKKGFPEEKLLPEPVHKMRGEGKKFAELGRLLILENKSVLLPLLYKIVLDVAQILDVDAILIVMKKSNYSSHKKIMAVNILSENMGFSWDKEKAELCLVEWDINANQEKFYKLAKRTTDHKFNKEIWNQYSTYHLGVCTSVQHQVYSELASKVKGHILDLGCGTGRIMGFIQENPQSLSYTGIDVSEGMIGLATELKERLAYKQANLILSNIENIEGKYDTIVSTLSYYCWHNKEKCLNHIKGVLSENGRFFLVTPNSKFDKERLTRLVIRDCFGHPYLDKFLSYNYDISEKANYPTIEELIEQVKKAGFSVISAHSNFFLGGVSCLELENQL